MKIVHIFQCVTLVVGESFTPSRSKYAKVHIGMGVAKGRQEGRKDPPLATGQGNFGRGNDLRHLNSIVYVFRSVRAFFCSVRSLQKRKVLFFAHELFPPPRLNEILATPLHIETNLLILQISHRMLQTYADAYLQAIALVHPHNTHPDCKRLQTF